MTKSEIFKAAHKLAKATVCYIGDYMIAFSIALKNIIAAAKKNVSAEKIEAMTVIAKQKMEIKAFGFTVVPATYYTKETVLFTNGTSIKHLNTGVEWKENHKVHGNINAAYVY